MQSIEDAFTQRDEKRPEIGQKGIMEKGKISPKECFRNSSTLKSYNTKKTAAGMDLKIPKTAQKSRGLFSFGQNGEKNIFVQASVNQFSMKEDSRQKLVKAEDPSRGHCKSSRMLSNITMNQVQPGI